MSDLYDQCRILYHLYFLSLTGGKSGYLLMIRDKELKDLNRAGTLIPALNRLKMTGYVKDAEVNVFFGPGLEITSKGLIAIETLFRKFLKYMKKINPDELGTWINNLELNANNSLKLIRDSLHFIKYEPPVRNAFHAFLNDLGSLENLTSFEVEIEQSQQNLVELVDDVFQHISDINKLFEHKLGRKLFCNAETFPIMNKAVRGKKVSYVDFVASVALLIDGICHKEIEDLVEPGKEFKGSISKIESILKHYNISYNLDTISKLRNIRQVRNVTPPMHQTGSQEVDDVKKIGLTFPIENPGEAVLTILKSLIFCLKEMKTWFPVK